MIPAEAVEAAAKAVYEDTFGKSWAEESEEYRNELRGTTRAALEAAAPHMVAGLRAELVNLAKDFDAAEGGTLAYTSPNGLRKNAHDQLMYIAENYLGEQPHD